MSPMSPISPISHISHIGHIGHIGHIILPEGSALGEREVMRDEQRGHKKNSTILIVEVLSDYFNLMSVEPVVELLPVVS